jgi:hypothetical protein
MGQGRSDRRGYCASEIRRWVTRGRSNRHVDQLAYRKRSPAQRRGLEDISRFGPDCGGYSIAARICQRTATAGANRVATLSAECICHWIRGSENMRWVTRFGAEQHDWLKLNRRGSRSTSFPRAAVLAEHSESSPQIISRFTGRISNHQPLRAY